MNPKYFLIWGWLFTGVALAWYNFKVPEVPNMDAAGVRAVGQVFKNIDIRSRGIFNVLIIGRFALMDLGLFLGFGGLRRVKLDYEKSSSHPFVVVSSTPPVALSPVQQLAFKRRREFPLWIGVAWAGFSVLAGLRFLQHFDVETTLQNPWLPAWILMGFLAGTLFVMWFPNAYCNAPSVTIFFRTLK